MLSTANAPIVAAGFTMGGSEAPRQPSWSGWLDLLAQREAAVAACGDDAVRVRVAAAPRFALGDDEHVLAQGRKVVAAQRQR